MGPVDVDSEKSSTVRPRANANHEHLRKTEKNKEFVPCNGMLSYNLNLEAPDAVDRSTVRTTQRDLVSRSKLQGDYMNIVLLVFLYVLQGVPLGLTASIPMILQNRHVSYKQQAAFSFAYWPFSLKLLWAPLVDAWYSRKFGRRRTWLIPTQYLIGLFLLLLSHYVAGILGDSNREGDPSSSATVEDKQPNIFVLTMFFFVLNFLASTQDIAVDGWALTMLSKVTFLCFMRNVGYASTCNSVGQTAGYFLGNIVFLALESSEFCNSYLRSAPSDRGMVTMSEYVYFWAIAFIVSTTMVMLLKRESRGPSAESEDLNVLNTYKWLWRVIRLKPVLTLMLVHLTAKIAFGAADGVSGLKLIEFGVPKEKLALLALPLIPLQIIFPILIGKYTAGPRPMRVYLKAYPYRNVMSIFFAAVVYATPYFGNHHGHFPVFYYCVIILVYSVHQVTAYSMFVSQMAFHAQISDPNFGGTYMSLLNTLANLGANWPVTVALSVVDSFTWKYCAGGVAATACVSDKQCSDGGTCATYLDGYWVLIAGGIVIGLLWRKHMAKYVDQLHEVRKRDWSCNNNDR